MCAASCSSETYFGTFLIAETRSLTVVVLFLAWTIDAANLAAALWLIAHKALKSPMEAFPMTPFLAVKERNS